MGLLYGFFRKKVEQESVYGPVMGGRQAGSGERDLPGIEGRQPALGNMAFARQEDAGKDARNRGNPTPP
jgi:hypothetical protein